MNRNKERADFMYDLSKLLSKHNASINKSYLDGTIMYQLDSDDKYYFNHDWNFAFTATDALRNFSHIGIAEKDNDYRTQCS